MNSYRDNIFQQEILIKLIASYCVPYTFNCPHDSETTRNLLDEVNANNFENLAHYTHIYIREKGKSKGKFIPTVLICIQHECSLEIFEQCVSLKPLLGDDDIEKIKAKLNSLITKYQLIETMTQLGEYPVTERLMRKFNSFNQFVREIVSLTQVHGIKSDEDYIEAVEQHLKQVDSYRTPAPTPGSKCVIS